jgi:ABC-type nitrate/sulfonate/bicarbonate transport system permease component
MGGGFLALVIGAVLLVVPFWKLLPRYGISQYVAILAVIPVVALILLWIIAFKDDFEGQDE